MGTEEKVLGNLEFNRFGLICVVLLIAGCTGGFAVGLGGVNEYWSLIMIVVPTMTTLALLLAVSPMRLIMTAGIITTAINTLFILYYLFT